MLVQGAAEFFLFCSNQFWLMMGIWYAHVEREGARR